MGWTSMHRPKGFSTRDFLASSFHPSKIIASVSTMGVTYAAVEKPDGYVFGLVLLTRFNRDHYNFSYKDVSEDMGPYEADCPPKILDLLSDPPFNDHATQWRARCRRRAARRQMLQALKPGDVVEFEWPVVFTDNEAHSRLFFQGRCKRKYTFEPEPDRRYSRYRLHLRTLVNQASKINGQPLPEA